MRDRVVKIGDISTQIRGVTYSKGEASNALGEGLKPILRAGNITEHGLTRSDLQYIPIGRMSAAQYIQKGDVIIAASTGSLRVIGKAAQAISNFDGAFGAFCKVLRPNEHVDARYFGHYFQTRRYREKVRTLAGGANINNLRNEHLNDLEILLPPLDEQRRIAAILDKADELRVKRREAIAKLDTLAQSIFIDMFGDPVTNPMGWGTNPVGLVGDVITGNTPSRAVADNYGDQIEWIKNDNIPSDDFYLTRATEKLSSVGMEVGRVVPPNSILVVCIAGSLSSIGRAAMTDRDVAFNQQINAIVPRSVEPLFLLVQLRLLKKSIQNASTKSMKGMVNKSKFSSIKTIDTPHDEQLEFVSRIHRVIELRNDFHSAEESENELFNSLQQRAFQGEL